jgi:hypothetical protein
LDGWETGVRFYAWERDILLSTASKPDHIQQIPVGGGESFSLGIKRPEREADNITEVKSVKPYLHFPIHLHSAVFHYAQGIN